MRQLSFSQRLKSGWSKEQLMKYYVMDEKHYDKVLASLERIMQEKAKI